MSTTAPWIDLGGYSPADITDFLREGRTMEFVRRFVLGNEGTAGPTETYDAKVAEALLLRLLELVEDGAI